MKIVCEKFEYSNKVKVHKYFLTLTASLEMIDNKPLLQLISSFLSYKESHISAEVTTSDPAMSRKISLFPK